MDSIPAEMMGPKLSALPTELMRRFAYIMGCGALSAAQAARDAGYQDSSEAAKVKAHYLMHDPKVIAAINEVARKVLDGLAPVAIRAAREILENPKHPARPRMVEVILDRTGYIAETQHNVRVEHTVDLRELEELARRLALENGIAPEKFIGINTGPVIEGEVSRESSEER